MDDNIRRYAKTARAWQAIARRDFVGREAHALLLMVNGRRTDQEIGRLLGANVTPQLQHLEQQGYLQFAAIVVPEPDDDDDSDHLEASASAAPFPRETRAHA